MKVVFTGFSMVCMIMAQSSSIGEDTLTNGKNPISSEYKDGVSKTTDSAGVFNLGQIVVKGKKSSADNLTNQIDSKKMEEKNVTNAAEALNELPGVSISVIGARNETGVNIRGFDLRQVPLYLDGIPQYVPYDGYVDLGRFVTFDLSEVRVEKGYSSVLYGPNAMGGAINLITRKPAHKFELDATIGSKAYKDEGTELSWLPQISGDQAALNIGSKLNNKFYMMAGVSAVYLNAFNLSEDFTNTADQMERLRKESYHRDVKVSAKVGFTPVSGSEYALSYMFQHGEKGVPVYAGPDATVKPRYWRWPYWDKQSIYLNSKTQIGNTSYIKGTIFYDQFKNSLYSYDDVTYTTFKKPYAFKSWYDDFSFGAGVEAGSGLLPYNDMRVAMHYKRDFHSELNSNDTSKNVSTFIFLDETRRYFIDHTYDIGLEDGVKFLNNKMSANGGISIDHRQSERADNYIKYHFVKTIFIPDSIFPFEQSKSNAFNIQGRLGFDPFKGNNLNLSLSRKTRFPTIKDRYSFKLGTAYPNADLKPETANNLELSYCFTMNRSRTALVAQCNLFYSRIDDAIQSVTVDAIAPDSGTKTRMENVGKATMPGIEVALNYTILRDVFLVKCLELSGNYSYLEKENVTDSTVKFTDIPKNKCLLSLRWEPIERSYISGNFEWNSKRYVDSKGTRELDGFHVFNIKACAGITKNMSFEFGVNNLMDANYSLQEGYPEEGRTFYTNIRINYYGM